MDLDLSDDEIPLPPLPSPPYPESEDEQEQDWEDGNVSSPSSSPSPPPSPSKRDFSHLNLPDSVILHAPTTSTPNSSAPIAPDPAPPKKKKQRRNPSKSLKNIANTSRKHGHLIRKAEDVHNSTVLSHIASLHTHSSTSSTLIPQLLSLLPPLGLDVELDRLYDIAFDGETRRHASRKNLNFIFRWFCDVFAHSYRNNKKTKNKRSTPPTSLSSYTRDLISSLFNLPTNPSLNAPVLLASLLRMLNQRCRIVASIPTPHPKDVTPFLLRESTTNILKAISDKTTRTVFAMNGVDLRVKGGKVGATAADAIELDDENENDKNPTLPISPPSPPPILPTPPTLYWVEVYSIKEKRWLHLDPLTGDFDQPATMETKLRKEWNENPGKGEVVKEARSSVAYIVAVEHGLDANDGGMTVTDVTRRYSASFTTSKLLRNENWFQSTLGTLNTNPFGSNEGEENELAKLEKSEKAPTSKERFRNHPKFVLSSQLKRDEVLQPKASRKNGMFAGEFIFTREDVSIARSNRKWLFQGRKVKDEELGKPAKEVVKRKMVASSYSSSTSFAKRAAASKNVPKKSGGPPSFGLNTYNLDTEGTKESMEKQKRLAEEDVANEALPNGAQEMEALFGEWQTTPWSPPRVKPGEPIPRNEFNNIELGLLNSGLVHLPTPGISRVAKKLGIDYAPCLVEFDYHSGRPVIKGIAVHECNKFILEEAWGEMGEIWRDEHEKKLVGRWKLLVTKLLLDKRLEEEWGNGEVNKIGESK